MEEREGIIQATDTRTPARKHTYKSSNILANNKPKNHTKNDLWIVNHCLRREKKKLDFVYAKILESYSWIHSPYHMYTCTDLSILTSVFYNSSVEKLLWREHTHTRDALCVIGWKCLHQSCLSHIPNAAEINTLGIQTEVPQWVMLDVVVDDYVSIDGRFFWTICLFICLFVWLVHISPQCNLIEFRKSKSIV